MVAKSQRNFYEEWNICAFLKCFSTGKKYTYAIKKSDHPKQVNKINIMNESWVDTTI